MKHRSPWLLAGLVTLVSIIQVVVVLQAAATPVKIVEQTVFVLSIALIAVIGALIVDRRTGNRIGWLLVSVAGVTALPAIYDPVVLEVFLPGPPPRMTFGIWLVLWLQWWFWPLQMALIFHIVLRFPTGDLLSPRWRWINWVTLGTVVLSALVAMFSGQIGPIDNAWKLQNPLGYLQQAAFDGLSLFWVIGLLALAAGSLVSIIQRFRQGTPAARQQIKWLLYAGALMVAIVAFGLVWFSTFNTSPIWLNIFVQIALMTLPLAIANAILRYRLYDIDIIIRRTLSYSVLTAVLSLVFFGGVVLLQTVFGGLFGDEESPLITVLTTLAIAALFNPLRTRIQDFIDRQFFRSKYDVEKALAEFSVVARDEVDLARLSGSLLSVVENTMQPERTSLWLKQRDRKRAG